MGRKYAAWKVGNRGLHKCKNGKYIPWNQMDIYDYEREVDEENFLLDSGIQEYGPAYSVGIDHEIMDVDEFIRCRTNHYELE